MSLSPKPSYPIADFAQLLSDRADLDLSPIELAEILWLALQKGEVVTGEQKFPERTQPPPKKKEKEPSSPPTQPQEPSESQPQNGAKVVSEPPKTREKGRGKIEKEGTALPVNIPETVALRNRREISRSLRPLMRKVPSKLRQEIDEAATVTHIAETQTWNPVVKPEPERWLELAIVVEVTNLLEVWRETIAEFSHVMERQGAFRDVRTWQLKSNKKGHLGLFLQTASGLKGSARRPKELRDFGGRRMVLFLSDCTSKAWRSGKILNLLELWSRTNPVTIVQLLPEHYWDRTALDSGYAVALKSRHPGALSRDWRIDGLSSRQRQRLPQEGLKFPVITIQPIAIAEWSKAIATSGEQRATGILLGLEAFQSREAIGVTPPLTARQLVRQFRATASDRAQELADRMAVLPVNWSVIRLVQKNWQQEGVDPLQETVALPLAEIFLSGLISYQLIGSSAKGGETRQYDFVEEVRDVLLGAIPISEAQEVGEEVATAIFKQLPPEVQERVAKDIERRYGESLSYFEAFLIPDLPWGEEAEAEILPFARVTGEVLRRWGGEYAVLAEELRKTPTVSKELAEFPLIKFFEFEVATIEEEAETLLDKLFEFEVALIEVNQSVLSNKNNLLEILDEQFVSKTGKHLNNVEHLLIQGTLDNQTYEQIAASAEYSVRHLRNVALKLWGVLSEVFGEKVSKRNLKKVLERWSSRPNLTIHRHQQRAVGFIEDLGDGVGLDMVFIPGGSFMMGSPKEELDNYDDEQPQHEVNVSDFIMGRYPITQEQWRVVASWEQIERQLEPDPSDFKEDYEGIDRWQRPVENISWEDVKEFCARLSKKTGREYRLPTEAEWEYVCRAGTTTPFHFGETISTELANYNGSVYGEGDEGENRVQTTPVGYFKVANAFGLCDLHGNVWEWCEDDWHKNYENAPTDGSAWVLGDSSNKVVRGGSWDFNPNYCRSAFRYNDTRGSRYYAFGVRVVCVAPRTT